MRAYFINAADRRIEPIEYDRGGFRHWLPGGICVAYVFPSRDVLYVDDECLNRPATVAFRIRARPYAQPMMSSGILTGRDHGDDTLPPRMTPDELAAELEWLDRDAALAWFRERADVPCVTSSLRGETIVHARWGDYLPNLLGEPGGYRMADDEALIKRM